MPALVAGIHVLILKTAASKDVDGRDKPGHDEPMVVVMNYWLVKSEPSSWSWDQQVAKGAKGEAWTGGRNFTARQNLLNMKKGDRAFMFTRFCRAVEMRTPGQASPLAPYIGKAHVPTPVP